MNGIVISLDPIILRIGDFEMRWYSVIVILAVVVAGVIWEHQSRKKGIPSGEIYRLAPWALVAGLVGARLFHVIDHWNFYVANPLQIIQLQQGGLAIWGVIAGVTVTTIIYARLRHLPLGRLMDAAVPAILVALILSRLACTINGDAPGGVTSLPWGFIYTHPDAMIPAGLFGVPTHPYPVYEMLWNGTILVLVWRLGAHLKRDGLLFLGSLSLYSMGRFVLTFVRQENITLWGLQQAQVIALITLLASLAVIIYLVWLRQHIRRKTNWESLQQKMLNEEAKN
ncbi:MAG: prolipoprotein diacylglyceryl transferase [Dehalococcoidales bacterium]